LLIAIYANDYRNLLLDKCNFLDVRVNIMPLELLVPKIASSKPFEAWQQRRRTASTDTEWQRELLFNNMLPAFDY
jgi:hypothetical protein